MSNEKVTPIRRGAASDVGDEQAMPDRETLDARLEEQREPNVTPIRSIESERKLTVPESIDVLLADILKTRAMLNVLCDAIERAELTDAPAPVDTHALVSVACERLKSATDRLDELRWNIQS